MGFGKFKDMTVKPTVAVGQEPRQASPETVPSKYIGATNNVDQLVDEVLAGVPLDKAVTIINRAMRDPQFTGITKDSLTFHRIHIDDGWYDE